MGDDLFVHAHPVAAEATKPSTGGPAAITSTAILGCFGRTLKDFGLERELRCSREKEHVPSKHYHTFALRVAVGSIRVCRGAL